MSAIDVAGSGGTSWSEVEYHRAGSDQLRRLARAFADWGIPTAESLRLVREVVPDMALFASGGLRGGVDIAKCLALGADLGGMAGPFLKAADQGVEAVAGEIEATLAEIRVAMFVAGAKDIAALRELGRLLEI